MLMKSWRDFRRLFSSHIPYIRKEEKKREVDLSFNSESVIFNLAARGQYSWNYLWVLLVWMAVGRYSENFPTVCS